MFPYTSTFLNTEDMGSIHGLGISPGAGMATRSSILDWETPWTEEPGGRHSTRLQSQTRLSKHARN